MAVLSIDVVHKKSPLRGANSSIPSELPVSRSQIQPSKQTEDTNASLFFIGTATTVLIKLRPRYNITDFEKPNFLHAGDHVHLGPGVTGTRKTNPAVDIEKLPEIDVVLLSHYHADHFDEVVEERLRRDLPIISTPHAQSKLANKDPPAESFTSVQALDFWDELLIDVKNETQQEHKSAARVTGMPGKHVPPGPLSVANDILNAVPPTNGWMLELGYYSKTDSQVTDSNFQPGYRIYITGDTLLINELHQIPELYSHHTGKGIDLMLIHLGGTTIPGPNIPLLMVTMDAKMGIELVKIINADITIPIHYDDYDVFLSPRSDFEKEVSAAGLDGKVIYLNRGDQYKFQVKKPSAS